jgi:hypothetical protein
MQKLSIATGVALDEICSAILSILGTSDAVREVSAPGAQHSVEKLVSVTAVPELI